jgi:arginine/lysine/ornithine decarboxylase
VEGLYISTGLIKSYPKNILKDDDRNLILTPLIRVVIQQRESVDELVKMLGTVEQSEPITSLLTDLNSLQSSYKAMNIEEQIKNNRSDLILSDKNLATLTTTIEKLRKSITE